jgi:O6-methylguanine-DNA--protein-cysteine methyltransferase
VTTRLGTFGVEATAVGVSRIRLPGHEPAAEGDREDETILRRAAAQLEEYARGEREEFDLPLDWRNVSPEHRKVLETLSAIAHI